MADAIRQEIEIDGPNWTLGPKWTPGRDKAVGKSRASFIRGRRPVYRSRGASQGEGVLGSDLNDYKGGAGSMAHIEGGFKGGF